jgi:ribosome recycling factor
MTPINQVGTVNVPEPRMVTVNVWDKSLVGKVEKAIRESGLASTRSSTARSSCCRSPS